MVAGPEVEEYGIHGCTVINAFTVRTERMALLYSGISRAVFPPKFIAYPLSATCRVFTFRNYELRHSDNLFRDRFLGAILSMDDINLLKV